MRKIYDEFYENDVGDAFEKSELDEYLDVPPEKMDVESFEILKWWSEKCTTYKILVSMAKDILAISVYTVASESAFITSGRVVDDFRSSLGPKTVEALICAQDWLRASRICIDIEQYLEDVNKYEEEIGRNDLDETCLTTCHEVLSKSFCLKIQDSMLKTHVTGYPVSEPVPDGSGTGSKNLRTALTGSGSGSFIPAIPSGSGSMKKGRDLKVRDHKRTKRGEKA
ncbi:hypothetical protein OSB04_017151 [Centaurea solstitialis]|uniref:HAT C-terminal dimerisation domain-containing protein n=1 Tax=Centaurea solstitialis TaxID=347529 RepID=A0AA38TDC8_9ASTR|nr:hypothetical protein OSB04_017151 [Centaurea solstitialis]